MKIQDKMKFPRWLILPLLFSPLQVSAETHLMSWTPLVAFLLDRFAEGGLDPPPGNIHEYLFGAPCECKGGPRHSAPSGYIQSIDCGTKVAYMAAELNENIGGFKQPKWVCVNKPGLVVPNPTETLGSCPATCHYTPAMHISCYTSASICVNNQGKQYFEAILTNTRGEWGTTYNYIPFLGDRGGEGITTRLTEAGCEGVVGKPSCWPMQAPIGVSDGGGPTDAIKHLQVIKLLKPEIPKPTYHPLILPKSQLPDLDANTLDILETTFSLLNSSNPTLDDVQTLSGTIKDLQDQIDSLAEVVLQNRRGLDLLTANQGGICLALGERCCFYANKSGIVRTKIKQLQEDLEKRRRELFENPLWTGLNGFLPYLLPLLGPLLGLLLVVAIGPCIVNKIVQFIKDQINILASKPIQVHYQRLKMDDRPSEIYFRPIRR
ncbi:uncharacterized protein LOC107146789 [Marmota marmota marmota]|uniref:uncharacterized protein LOC107146789 n=1 Tax=Marmota marmota marmota TaxID=9994 RepID=UPI0020928E9A|nr:uncharacterized protein LOC107146789 [Marmota marmota marmota]